MVENFSYVFQTDGATSLDREQMRSFKKNWANFDIHRTGFIGTKDIVPFLAVSHSFDVTLMMQGHLQSQFDTAPDWNL